MNCQNQQARRIQTKFLERYEYFSPTEVEFCYNTALKDLVLLTYPSKNNRPPIDKLELDFYDEQWVLDRMEDIISREGVNHYTSYKENGISFTYASSYIDPNLVAQITPKVGVPR